MPKQNKAYIVYWNATKRDVGFFRIPEVFSRRCDAEEALREKLDNHWALAWKEEEGRFTFTHPAGITAGYIEEVTLVHERKVPQQVFIEMTVTVALKVNETSPEEAVDEVWRMYKELPTRKTFVREMLIRAIENGVEVDLESVAIDD